MKSRKLFFTIEILAILIFVNIFAKKILNNTYMEQTRINLQKQQKRTEISLAVNTALTQLGITSGELTYAGALKVYGQWFANAVRNGRIAPIRFGEGKTPTKWYSVADILAYKAVELEEAQVILNR